MHILANVLLTAQNHLELACQTLVDDYWSFLSSCSYHVLQLLHLQPCRVNFGLWSHSPVHNSQPLHWPQSLHMTHFPVFDVFLQFGLQTFRRVRDDVSSLVRRRGYSSLAWASVRYRRISGGGGGGVAFAADFWCCRFGKSATSVMRSTFKLLRSSSTCHPHSSINHYALANAQWPFSSSETILGGR